ncbi:NAD(P)H-hydrate dehydratase [Bdellovibrio sp. qaytius]|nr:NAD(P)H-hydrate dehydratase [Bdellovibrio sp. qaytius]
MMPTVIRISKKNLPALLPKRTKTVHKQNGGKCLIIAGSPGLWGASILCAKAAYRVGAGYVYLPEKTKDLILHPDFVSMKISVKTNFEPFAAIAIGPGSIATSDLRKVYESLLKKFKGPVIVDAGALKLIKKIPEYWIMTPHEAELARLLNSTADKIRADRFQAVQLAQKTFGGIVILKGPHTLIANSKNIFEITTGNKALAKAGTGDVLCGMIAGFLSQGLSPTKACVLGCGLHGYIADEWVKKNDYLSLMASEVIDLIPQAIFKLRKSQLKKYPLSANLTHS